MKYRQKPCFEIVGGLGLAYWNKYVKPEELSIGYTSHFLLIGPLKIEWGFLFDEEK